VLLLTFPCSLTREKEGPNKGSFKDSDLASLLQGALVIIIFYLAIELTYCFRTSHRAASFGARGTPAVMRLHEIMGIEANRAWGVCSLNDFRKFLGLKSEWLSIQHLSWMLSVLQHTPVSWNGILTMKLLTLPKSSMVTSTTWSCTSASRPKRPSL
jgi:hypothetical protein